MNKAQPAPFHASIEELTEHELLYRLLIGLENMPGTREEIDQEIAKLPQEVFDFWRNEDHGLAHSKQVLERALVILRACPNMLRACYLKGVDPIDIGGLLTWASILHDFARFTSNSSLAEHQLAGANLARGCFRGEMSESVCDALYGMIRHHDYICEFVDGKQLPSVFIENPLAEIFRLADKTSLPPVEEILRYYATGKRLNASTFFDADLPLETRFDFESDKSAWDFVNYFLLFFAIQPSDWFFGETRALYRQWQEKTAGGKSRAAAKIIQLAADEGLDIAQIVKLTDVMDKFFWKYGLPNYVG